MRGGADGYRGWMARLLTVTQAGQPSCGDNMKASVKRAVRET
jgi:hypothetical protein